MPPRVTLLAGESPPRGLRAGRGPRPRRRPNKSRLHVCLPGFKGFVPLNPMKDALREEASRERRGEGPRKPHCKRPPQMHKKRGPARDGRRVKRDRESKMQRPWPGWRVRSGGALSYCSSSGKRRAGGTGHNRRRVHHDLIWTGDERDGKAPRAAFARAVRTRLGHARALLRS
jgi:hypothetical protein